MADSKHKLHHTWRGSASKAISQVTHKGKADQNKCDASSASAMPRPSSEIFREELSRKRLKASRTSCPEGPRTTILHRAVELADERTVRSLVRKEQHLVDVQDTNGETALHVAARLGYKHIAAKLAPSGSCARLQNQQGHTPLHVALYCRKKDTAAAIVDVDPGNVVQDERGNTPLHLAAQNGYSGIVRDLLAASFNTRVQNKESLTPLHVALCYRKEDAANVIIDTASVNQVRDKDGDTPLHHAAREGYVDIVRKLLAKGASAHLQGQYGRTPLHVALFYGKEDVANVIIDTASVNEVPDKDGDTPLHHAAREGYVGVVRKLLAAGVNVHLQGRHGFTPLYTALFYREGGAANAIIDAVLASEEQIEHADFLLHLALDAGYQEIAKKLLLRCNVHPHVMNNRRRFPLVAALNSRLMDAAKVILSVCALRGIAINWNCLNVTQNKIRHCPELLAECEAEVRRMKQAKLGSTCISYYDVAIAHVHKLTVYLTNNDIREVLLRENVKAVFPNYAELIGLKVEKAEVRRILRDQWLDCFSVVSSEFLSLPVTSIEVILAFLSEKDLKNFVEAFTFKT